MTHSKSYTAIQEHKRIDDLIYEKIWEIQKRSTSDSGAIIVVEDIMRKHKDYYKELHVDAKEFIDAAKEGVPKLFKDDGELKDQNEWMKECKMILHGALEATKNKEPTLDEACENLEKMVITEIAAKNASEDADTHLVQDYLDHMTRVNLWPART